MHGFCVCDILLSVLVEHQSCLPPYTGSRDNEDWNYSAPHGAGRVMGRKEARYKLKLEDFEKTMERIWNSTVRLGTIDKAPMVYKDMSEIVASIEPAAEIINVIKPVYNFKAAE